MRISTKDWLHYIGVLRSLNERAAEKMQEYVQRNGFGNTEELINVAYGLVTKYGEASAEIACQMYDAIAEMQNAAVPPAEPADTATLEETAKAINGSLKQSPTGQLISSTASRLVKQAGADTTLKNARRDGAEFAWIPSGDTCAFCQILASRGWQHISKKGLRNGHVDHIHANCDCNYIVRFDGISGVEGYDPEKLLADYKNAEGSNWKEKMNSMRRYSYPQNKDKYNTQKRELYAQHKEDDIIKQKEFIIDILKHGMTSDEICETIIANHKGLSKIAPAEMKEILESNGYDVKPLGKRSASLANRLFEDGGGFRTAFCGDGYFQYHPEEGSHHGGPYWKIQNGKTFGRYDLNGDEINNRR